MSSINTNMGSINAQANLAATQKAVQNSLSKLSSGYRITKAADDAAGLAISEKMRGQISGLKQASSNAQSAISLIQTGEGGLSETQSILQRMRELAVQSASDTNTTDDRTKIQSEVDQLSKEITRISNTTEFNTKNLLAGGLKDTYQIGANAGQNITLSVNAMDASSLGVAGTAGTAGTIAGSGAVASGASGSFVFSVDGGASKTIAITSGETAAQIVTAINSGANATIASLSGTTLVLTSNTLGTGSSVTVDSSTSAAIKTSLKLTTATTGTGSNLGGAASTAAVTSAGVVTTEAVAQAGLNVSTQSGANAAITTIDNAINKVSTERSKLGAVQNRLEHTINNLGTSSENLTAAESNIRDVDMAAEMSSFTKNQVLAQAGVAMLAQANQAPQTILKLLQ